MSSDDASATSPRTSSVAGFTFWKVAPLPASTSFPSISILGSGFTCGVSAIDLSSLGLRGPGPLVGPKAIIALRWRVPTWATSGIALFRLEEI